MDRFTLATNFGTVPFSLPHKLYNVCTQNDDVTQNYRWPNLDSRKGKLFSTRNTYWAIFEGIIFMFKKKNRLFKLVVCFVPVLFCFCLVFCIKNIPKYQTDLLEASRNTTNAVAMNSTK